MMALNPKYIVEREKITLEPLDKSLESPEAGMEFVDLAKRINRHNQITWFLNVLFILVSHWKINKFDSDISPCILPNIPRVWFHFVQVWWSCPKFGSTYDRSWDGSGDLASTISEILRAISRCATVERGSWGGGMQDFWNFISSLSSNLVWKRWGRRWWMHLFEKHKIFGLTKIGSFSMRTQIGSFSTENPTFWNLFGKKCHKTKKWMTSLISTRDWIINCFENIRTQQ